MEKNLDIQNLPISSLLRYLYQYLYLYLCICILLTPDCVWTSIPNVFMFKSSLNAQA